jgi:hypothetical protein
MLLPVQLQMLTVWMTARDRVLETITRARDERGELTANVVFLAALAVAAVGIAFLVVTKIRSNANSIPGGG